MDDETSGEDRPGSEQEGFEESPPLQDLVERIRSDDADEGIPEGGLPHDLDADSDFFQEESSGQIDTKAVWKAIESDWPDESDLADNQDADTEHVVPKQWYCEPCEYFSEPPEVRCTHSEAAILEFVGTEDVRVRNCPVVAERKALGQFQSD